MRTATTASGSFERLLDRLSAISGRNACDPLVDVDWDVTAADAASLGVGALPDDPMMDTLHAQRLAPDALMRFQGRRIADVMVTAMTFERVLQQGLLAYARTLPLGSAELRYLYYEVAEEARHSQTFDRLITLMGGPTEGLRERVEIDIQPFFERESTERSEMLFMSALAGEEPFDAVQRRVLAAAGAHPLLREVCDIHVREEARHLAYARRALSELVGRLSSKRRRRLGLMAPIVVLETAWVMLAPSPALLASVGVDLGADQYLPLRRALVADVFAATKRLRNLCASLGIWAIAQTSDAWVPNELRDPTGLAGSEHVLPAPPRT